MGDGLHPLPCRMNVDTTVDLDMSESAWHLEDSQISMRRHLSVTSAPFQGLQESPLRKAYGLFWSPSQVYTHLSELQVGDPSCPCCTFRPRLKACTV